MAKGIVWTEQAKADVRRNAQPVAVQNPENALPAQELRVFFRDKGEHRDDPEHGCPSAALLDEIGRCGDATKHAYTDGILGLVDEIASRLAPSDPQSARGASSAQAQWDCLMI